MAFSERFYNVVFSKIQTSSEVTIDDSKMYDWQAPNTSESYTDGLLVLDDVSILSNNLDGYKAIYNWAGTLAQDSSD